MVILFNSREKLERADEKCREPFKIQFADIVFGNKEYDIIPGGKLQSNIYGIGCRENVFATKEKPHYHKRLYIV